MDNRNGTRSVCRRSPIGDFLRTRREKLTPETLGLGKGRRRRTPGLRREEVAECAGIGVDWYTRLEQGRTVSPSTATIDALAEALRLSGEEHAHLRTLAATPARCAFSLESVPNTLRRMIEGLREPAYITGRRWDVLAWNDGAAELFPDLSCTPQENRNVLLHMLTAPAMKLLFAEAWAEEAKRMLARFRTTFDCWADDPAFLALQERLRQGCPEFENWWETHDVGSSAGVQKLLHHPTRGLLHFQTASFQANDDASLKLVIYTPL